ncbi:MAG: TonB-dependent receptor [Bacteroidales bacterium]|nr:TonB-dependent receptor [Bacteroidales bacterium]
MRKLNDKQQSTKVVKSPTRHNCYTLNILRHSILYFFVITLFLRLGAFAQVDTVKLDEIIVSGRVPAFYSESGRVVTIISKQEIESAPVQCVEDILEYISSVDIRQRGNNGVQADINVRGGSFDQVLILLNGVKINDPQTGHHNLNIPVDIESIEKIEILEGPGSRIFGTNAFSGAINIITKKTENKSINLSLTGGEHNYFNGTVSSTYSTKNIDNYIAVSKKKSSGYIENTDFNISNLFYQALVRTDIGNVSFQAGYNDKKFGANSFYSPKFPDQYEKTKTTFFSTKLNYGNDFKISPSVFFRRHQDHFRLDRNNPSFYTNNHLTNIYGAELNFLFNTLLGKTGFGLEYRSENILSNVLGLPMNDTIKVPDEPDWVFTHSKSRENLSAFLEHRLKFDNLSISFGFLTNYNSDFDWNFNPGIDINYKISKHVNLFSSYNQSVRIPTFTDLYYISSEHSGNIDLIPETAKTIEIGAKWINYFNIAHLSVFHRNGTNMIDWVKKPDSLKWESRNLTEIKTNGFEISEKLITKKIFGEKFPFEYFEISYLYLKSDKNSDDYISMYVLDYLKHKLCFNTTHKIYNHIGASWFFVYQDREGSFTDINNNNIDYSPFYTIDARIFYNHKLFKIFLDISNLFNKKYYDHANIQMPGRWIQGGIKINVNYGK